MPAPRLNIHLAKGEHGVPLEKLAAIANETVAFLTKLSVDLGDPESSDRWIAEDFSSQSVLFKVRREHPSRIEPETWYRAFHMVLANDYSDPLLNARISAGTRAQFWNITKPLAEQEPVFLAVENGDPRGMEWFEITRAMAQEATEQIPEFFESYGEIQGYVHAFYKEAKRPKLVVRELSTDNLVHCYFTPEMYEFAVELLKDRDAVIFVEGDVREDPNTGFITQIAVKNFTPAPEFDEHEFESMIGAFPGMMRRDKPDDDKSQS